MLVDPGPSGLQGGWASIAKTGRRSFAQGAVARVIWETVRVLRRLPRSRLRGHRQPLRGGSALSLRAPLAGGTWRRRVGRTPGSRSRPAVVSLDARLLQRIPEDPVPLFVLIGLLLSAKASRRFGELARAYRVAVQARARPSGGQWGSPSTGEAPLPLLIIRSRGQVLEFCELCGSASRLLVLLN